METFRLEILTPTRRFVAEEAESIVFETHDGFMEVLSGHEALVVPVRPCVARIRAPRGDLVASLAEGFATLSPRKVEFFVDAAERPTEIDRERALRALGRAEARLASETLPWMIRRSEDAAARARARMGAWELGRTTGPGQA